MGTNRQMPGIEAREYRQEDPSFGEGQAGAEASSAQAVPSFHWKWPDWEKTRIPLHKLEPFLTMGGRLHETCGWRLGLVTFFLVNAEKMHSNRAREILKRRGAMVEGVSARSKTVQGANRFMRRGFSACASEWKLICAAHNLLELWRALNKQRKGSLRSLSGMRGKRPPGRYVHQNCRRESVERLVRF